MQNSAKYVDQSDGTWRKYVVAKRNTNLKTNLIRYVSNERYARNSKASKYLHIIIRRGPEEASTIEIKCDLFVKCQLPFLKCQYISD